MDNKDASDEQPQAQNPENGAGWTDYPIFTTPPDGSPIPAAFLKPLTLIQFRYWTDLETLPGDPEGMPVPRFLWFDIFTNKNNRYFALITIGGGRGVGFSIPDLAERVTRRLEDRFGIPAARTCWGIRHLTTAEVGLSYDGKPVPVTTMGTDFRKDWFRVQESGSVRVAVACTDKAACNHLGGVLFERINLPELPKRQPAS